MTGYQAEKPTVFGAFQATTTPSLKVRTLTDRLAQSSPVNRKTRILFKNTMTSPGNFIRTISALFLALALITRADDQPTISLRVATAQIPVTNSISENSATIHRALRTAIEEKADILLTPEGSLSGYTPEFDQAEVDRELTQIIQVASNAGIALALGTCYVEPDDKRCYNQIRFYNRSGKFLGFHSKTLLCGSFSTPPHGEINDYSVRPLRTFEIKGIRVGGLICNDMWGNPQCTPMDDPHLSQKLSKAGAQIIFLAINGGRDGSSWSEEVNWPFHEVNMRMRAAAGRLWVVSADNSFPHSVPCSAPSGILMPNGQWAKRSPRQGEHVTVHTIELPQK